jgi:acyl carrier protein
MVSLEENIKKFIAAKISEVAGVSESDVGFDLPIAALGIDSVTTFELACALELRFGVELDPMLLMEQPTLEALCDAIAALCGAARAAELAAESVALADEILRRLEGQPETTS